jgi:hypothetical protein
MKTIIFLISILTSFIAQAEMSIYESCRYFSNVAYSIAIQRFKGVPENYAMEATLLHVTSYEKYLIEAGAIKAEKMIPVIYKPEFEGIPAFQIRAMYMEACLK